MMFQGPSIAHAREPESCLLHELAMSHTVIDPIVYYY